MTSTPRNIWLLLAFMLLLAWALIAMMIQDRLSTRFIETSAISPLSLRSQPARVLDQPGAFADRNTPSEEFHIWWPAASGVELTESNLRATAETIPSWFRLSDLPQGYVFDEVHIWRGGFPCRSRSLTILLDANGQTIAQSHRILPWGALVNTALLTLPAIVMLLLLWWIVRAAFKQRALSRIRLAKCPTCAYPTAGLTSPLCPECGTPVVRTD